MVDFKAYNAGTHRIVLLEDDYNNILAHGLEKVASYIYRINGGLYEVIKGGTASGAGTIAYGGADNVGGIDGTSAADTLNAALATDSPIFVKNGVYSFTDQVVGGNPVNIYGESMGGFDDFTNGVVFQDTGAGATPFLDFRDSRSCNLRDIKVHLNGGASTSGIRLGGEHDDAQRTKCSQWSNIVVDGFATGILGDTNGPDDTNFLNVYVGNASTIAVDHLSSQCKFFGGTFYDSEIGVRINRTGSTPDASMHFYGTVWSGVAKCVKVIGDENPRATSFIGAWFEDVDDYILNINDATAGLDVGHFHFLNCYGYVNTGGNIFELEGVSCRLIWEGGELWPQTSTTDIVTDGVGPTTQTLSIRLPTGNERIAYNDSNDGLRGWDRYYVKLFEEVGGYNTIVAAAWDDWGQNTDCPFRQYTCLKAKVYYSWNPMTVSGGIRLAYPATVAIPGTQTIPGAAGVRADTLTITPDFAWDTMGEDGHIVLEGIGDGATAPIVYQVGFIYEM